jgi:hypothetical protein
MSRHRFRCQRTAGPTIIFVCFLCFVGEGQQTVPFLSTPGPGSWRSCDGHRAQPVVAASRPSLHVGDGHLSLPVPEERFHNSRFRFPAISNKVGSLTIAVVGSPENPLHRGRGPTDPYGASVLTANCVPKAPATSCRLHRRTPVTSVVVRTAANGGRRPHASQRRHPRISAGRGDPASAAPPDALASLATILILVGYKPTSLRFTVPLSARLGPVHSVVVATLAGISRPADRGVGPAFGVFFVIRTNHHEVT